MNMLAAVKVRSNVKIRHGIGKTMDLLRLTRINHCVLVDEKQEPMLKKVENHITYGSVDGKTLARLLEKRGRLPGKKRITEKYLKEHKVSGFNELAQHIMEKKTTLQALGIEPVFTLSPPSKGYERGGIKKPFALGGALGDRKEKINALLARMM